MATLIDTLKSQGKATDYYSRKGLYESMGLDKQYGAYSGSAQQNIGFQNILLGGNPSPTQATGGQSTPTSNTPNANTVDTTGMTTLQKQYAEKSMNRPDPATLMDQYSQELGIPDQAKMVEGLTKSVMDLESKISKIEPMINERAQNFMVTEGQRQRMVNAEEKPLRDQYLEAARQKNYADAGLATRNNLLATRMKYATEGYDQQLAAIKDLISIEEANQKRQDELNKEKKTNSQTDWLEEHFKKKMEQMGQPSSQGAVAQPVMVDQATVDKELQAIADKKKKLKVIPSPTTSGSGATLKK
jgi:hypothetical protein